MKDIINQENILFAQIPANHHICSLMMQPVEAYFPFLSHPSSIVVTMHQKPDGDAMGSALAIYHFLQQFGHQVQVVSPTNWSSFLNWMPGCDKVLDFEKNTEAGIQIISHADYIFCLDFNVLHRTRHLEKYIESAKAQTVLIDHHEQPQIAFFTYGISNTAKSSTCEMVYDFIVASGHADKITTEVAQCLYTGLMTDTGSFRFTATTASVHKMVAHLKELGLQHTPIHDLVFDNYGENRLRFLGFVLLNRMEVLYEYNTALIAITKADLLRFHIQTGDTEGLVNYPLSIQGIRMAALVIDRDEERKWSFRSKGNLDVNTFARKYFHGGGHFSAAGGRSSESLADTVAFFKTAIEKEKELLQINN